MQTDSKQSGLQPARYRNTRSRWQVWILWNPIDLALLWFRRFPQNALNCCLLISNIPKTWSKELIVVTKWGLIKSTGSWKCKRLPVLIIPLFHLFQMSSATSHGNRNEEDHKSSSEVQNLASDSGSWRAFSPICTQEGRQIQSSSRCHREPISPEITL